MEEKLMTKLQLIDYAQHLLNTSMELLREMHTFPPEYRKDYFIPIDKINTIIEECIDKIQSI